MSVPATTNRSASHRGIANQIDTATRFRNAQVIETMSRNRSFVQVYPPLVFGPVISDNYPPWNQTITSDTNRSLHHGIPVIGVTARRMAALNCLLAIHAHSAQAYIAGGYGQTRIGKVDI